MDSEKNVSSHDVSSTGFSEHAENLSTPAKHKSNCIGNEIETPEMEMLINGISSDLSNQEKQVMVTPEMLYKLSKKIAQLTKVIYSLNTRNDDLESDLESTRVTYEERLEICQQQLDLVSSNVPHNSNLATNENPGIEVDSKALNFSQNKHHSDDPEMKQELKKTRSKLQHYEGAMKTMEEELRQKNKELDNTKAEVFVLNKKMECKQTDEITHQQLNNAAVKDNNETEPAGIDVTNSSDQQKHKTALLVQKIKKAEKEKNDLKGRLHRVEGENINFRIEQDMMKKDVAELNKEKSSLKVELSTARIQFNYDREVNGDKPNSSKGKDDKENGSKSIPNGSKKENGCNQTSEPDQCSSKRETTQVDFDDAFVQELMEKIEVLTTEKSEISHQLLQEKSSLKESNRKYERLEQEHKMELHQLENVKRDKKCEKNIDMKNNKSNFGNESSNGNASEVIKIHQTSQTEPVVANDLDNNNEKEIFSRICDEHKDTIDQLTKDKNDVIIEIKSMCDRLKTSASEHKKELEDNQEIINVYKEKSEKQDMEISEFKAQLARLKIDLEDETKNLQTLQDLESMRKEQIEEMESTRSNLDELQNKLTEAEMRVKASDSERERLSIVLAETNVKVDALEKDAVEGQTREVDLKLEMGQTAEKLYSSDERCKNVEKERDELKRRVKELEAKLEVIGRSKQAAESTISEKVIHLEGALEEALIEREEILEAADKEIQHTKNIAMETERKMMDDFEWKLREIEAENRDKLKTVETSVAGKIKTAQDEYMKKKDDELIKMSIGVRRDMEDKMRIERSSLKEALTTTNKRELEAAVDRSKLESGRELRMLQKSWEDEQTRLNREVITLQRKSDSLPDEITKATREMKSEHERRMLQEKRASSKAQEDIKKKCQDVFDEMKDELNGQLVRLREECANRVTELEKQLDTAHGNRMSSMFQMKEEVEVELGERMETLRNMYKTEIDSQSQQLENQKMSSEGIIGTLRDSIARQKHEIEELNIYYNQREEEFEAKTDDLLTRLQEQTSACMQLQDELDSYEWYEEDEDDNTGTVKANDSGECGAIAKSNHSRPPSARSHHGGHSRPSSTRPTDPQNINHQQKQHNTASLGNKLQPTNSLEPCIEPESDNTTTIPNHLSPSLSTASSGYFPQSSYTSASHSYYTTAEDNHIDEAKTSEESSPVPTRWTTNRSVSSEYDTQNKIHTENASGSLQATPIAIENPNPPPRKDRHDDSLQGASRHSSGKNSSGDADSSNTLHSQANAPGSTSNSHSGGSSANTKRTSLKSTSSTASGGGTSSSSGEKSEKSTGSNRKSQCTHQ